MDGKVNNRGKTFQKLDFVPLLSQPHLFHHTDNLMYSPKLQKEKENKITSVQFVYIS